MPSAPITQDVLLDNVYAINAVTVAAYFPPTPTRLHRITYVSYTANTGASAVLTVAVQQADGTAATPSGAALATMTVTAALAAVNLVTALNLQSVVGDIIVYPGERLNIVSDGGGTSGVGSLWLTVEALGYNDAEVRQHALAGAHPGSTDITTGLGNVTEVTS